MKVCFICGEYPPGPIGGVGTFTLAAARWLVKHGHQVKVIGPYNEAYPDIPYNIDEGVEVYRIKFKEGKFSWIPAWRKQYQQIKKWIENGEIDIVEAPESRGWFALWGKTNVPLVLRANGAETSFNTELGKKPNRLTYFLEKSSYARADDYCAVSKYIAEMNERMFQLPKKHHIIYNVVPSLPTEYKPVPREKDLVVFSGTLIEKKGVIELVKASLLLHSQNLPHRLVLNGKDTAIKERGSMRELLDGLIPENLKQHFTFTGHQTQDNLYKQYATATTAIFPSYAEAFAFAPMEAMIMGCPTIFTKRVSGPELIDDKIDGLLVDPANVEEIANAIKQILSDPELAKQLGEAGRQKILTKFNIEAVMPQTVAFYEQAIENFKKKQK